MARPQLNYTVVTATLKLEKENMRRFEAYLKSPQSEYHTKNSYIFNKVEHIVNSIKHADKNVKIGFVLDLLQYATPRKQIKDMDKSAFKCAVVSVKLKADTHAEAVALAQELGFSFSDMVRRCILKDVTEAGY